MWEAVERDWRTAPIDSKLRATLGFVEKLTLRPGELTRADAAEVLTAGVSRQALVDAADEILASELLAKVEEFHARADRMLASGYRLE